MLLVQDNYEKRKIFLAYHANKVHDNISAKHVKGDNNLCPLFIYAYDVELCEVTISMFLEYNVATFSIYMNIYVQTCATTKTG